jgi:predicted O-methyltransferase YrrM
MGLSGWLRLPAARLRARFNRVPDRPWVVPAAAGWLSRRIGGDWVVLELGAGRSTPWLARRSERVLSLEDNEQWVAETSARLRELGADNVDLRHLPVEAFAAEIAELEDESLDLVVVDFLESPAARRVDAVRAAHRKVRPGGLLLLDDSDRPAYRAAFDQLAGWRRRRFVGVKDGWPWVCETTVFRRPRSASRRRRGA